MNKKILKILYKSFDSELSDREKKILEKSLEQSEELRRERQKILEMRQHLGNAPELKFRPFFAQRTVTLYKSRIKRASEQKFLFSLESVFKPIAIAAMIALFSLMFYNMKTTHNYSLAGALGKEPAKLEQLVDPIYAMNLE